MKPLIILLGFMRCEGPEMPYSKRRYLLFILNVVVLWMTRLSVLGALLYSPSGWAGGEPMSGQSAWSDSFGATSISGILLINKNTHDTGCVVGAWEGYLGYLGIEDRSLGHQFQGSAGESPGLDVARVEAGGHPATPLLGGLTMSTSHRSPCKDVSLCKYSNRPIRNCQGIIYCSRAMEEVVARIMKAARWDVSVLITGETGTGKELVARAIQLLSGHKNGPFVAFNIAGLTGSMIEGQLSGHERGAFTGAYCRYVGLLEQAQHGTLLLDEIGDMPLAEQVRLLRVIQEREIRRVGGGVPIQVDFRLICATHHDLVHDIEENKFRKDLFYRIGVYQIKVPPLRERKEDIPELVEHFSRKFSEKHAIGMPQFSPEAMEFLVAHPWPGNVRELENAVEASIVESDGGEVFPAHVEAVIIKRTPATTSGKRKGYAPELTREILLKALIEENGNISTASRKLGLARQRIYEQLDEFNLRKTVHDLRTDSPDSPTDTFPTS